VTGLAYRQRVTAPPGRVEQVIRAEDGYPIWSSLVVHAADQRAVWMMPLRNGDVRPMRFAVTTEPRIVVRIESLLVRVDLHVELRSAGPGESQLLVTTTTSGLLRMLARRFALPEAVRLFCSELAQRAFWLNSTPDSRAAPDLHDDQPIDRPRRPQPEARPSRETAYGQ
jgi:hypothetical protein